MFVIADEMCGEGLISRYEEEENLGRGEGNVAFHERKQSDQLMTIGSLILLCQVKLRKNS